MSDSIPTITLSIIHWPSQPSRCSSSTGSPRPGPANQSYAPRRNSMPWWNMAMTMFLAGLSGKLCRNIYQNTQIHLIMSKIKLCLKTPVVPVASEGAGDGSR